MNNRPLPPFLINLFDAVLRLPKNLMKLPPLVARTLKSLAAGLGDAGVLMIWIGGFVLAGCLVWGLSWRPRMQTVVNLVNKKLEMIESAVTLEAPVSPWLRAGRRTQLGVWFTLAQGQGMAIVYSIPHEGVLLPFAAIIDNTGIVTETLALSVNAEKTITRMHPGIPLLWTRRIEALSREDLQKGNGGE
jgi:hypothetical protein